MTFLVFSLEAIIGMTAQLYLAGFSRWLTHLSLRPQAGHATVVVDGAGKRCRIPLLRDMGRF
jgi:hypothetical protein